MHPVSQGTAKLLRRIRRRDMRIGKLKRELRKLRRRRHKMEDERKAIITVVENGGIDVEIEFFPDAGHVGISGALAMIGFQSIVNEYKSLNREEGEE